MLLEASQTVFGHLSGYAPLTDLLTRGAQGIRPLFAGAEDGEDFLTYAIVFEGSITKGQRHQLKVVVQAWADHYEDSLKIADAVADAFESQDHFYTYESAKPVFNEQQEFYTELIFNLKK